jgi:O-Antigen ligase
MTEARIQLATKRTSFAPFTEVLFLGVVAGKPLWDGLYWFSPAKYLYHFVFFFLAFLAFAGEKISQGYSAPSRSGSKASFALAGSLGYAAYIVAVYFANGRHPGTLEILFKTLDPFITFWVLMVVPRSNFRSAAYTYVALVIFGNCCLLPAPYGWTDWGDARTFRGMYFFKTDLAFAVVSSIILLMVIERNRFSLLFVSALAIGGIEVILSNARMNYALYVITLVVAAYIRGLRLRSIIAGSLILVAVVSAALFQQSSNHSLGFDLSNPAALTQGRTNTWDIDIKEGLLRYSATEWLVGRGLSADTDIISLHTTANERFDPHNEALHLLLTQGVFGLLLYATAWITIYRYVALDAQKVSELRIPAALAMTVLGLQSLTANLSFSATKTWPVMLILACVLSECERRRADPQHTSATGQTKVLETT